MAFGWVLVGGWWQGSSWHPVAEAEAGVGHELFDAATVPSTAPPRDRPGIPIPAKQIKSFKFV